MKQKIGIVAVCGLLLAFCAAGCGGKEPNAAGNEELRDLNQTAMPEEGEEIAVMEVAGMGTIRLRLFPEAAPKAVENFKTHARDGYYNGVTFHRIVNDFMIQGGDPTGMGGGGESIWGEPFEDECNDVLMPIRGALCMANRGADTNGSQFFIVQAKDPNLETASGLTEAQKKLFEENGGTPWLAGLHTVFGQVIQGMDVVDAIAAEPADPESGKPLEDVVITEVKIEKYSG